MACAALNEAREMIINKDVKMAKKSAEPGGLTRLNSGVQCFIIHRSSEPPRRRSQNLQTFKVKRKGQQKHKQELKDHKLQIACLCRKIAFSRQTNTAVSISTSLFYYQEQFVLLMAFHTKETKQFQFQFMRKFTQVSFQLISINQEQSLIASSLTACFLSTTPAPQSVTRPFKIMQDSCSGDELAIQ